MKRKKTIKRKKKPIKRAKKTKENEIQVKTMKRKK